MADYIGNFLSYRLFVKPLRIPNSRFRKLNPINPALLDKFQIPAEHGK